MAKRVEAFMDARRYRSASAVMDSIPAMLEWYANPERKVPHVLNKGRLTFKQYQDHIDAHNAWVDDLDGSKDPDVSYAKYQPADFQFAKDTGMTVIVSGQAIKHPTKPKDWLPEYGDFRPGDYLVGGDRKVKVRTCHERFVKRLIDDHPENVVEIEGVNYGVGTGKADGSIISITCPQKSGNFESIAVQRYFASSDKLKGLANLVARFNQEPAVVVVGDDELAFFPEQVMTLGYFINGGDKPMTPSQVRRVAADGGKTPKWRALPENDESLIGRAVPWDDLWNCIKEDLGKDGIAKLSDRKSKKDTGKKTPEEIAEKKTYDNSVTTLRVHPSAGYCFGLTAIQTHVVPYIVTDVDGKVSQGIAVGWRTNESLNVTKQDAKKIQAEDEAADKKLKDDKAKDKAKSKPKSSKPKSDKKPKDKVAPEIKVAEVESSETSESSDPVQESFEDLVMDDDLIGVDVS